MTRLAKAIQLLMVAEGITQKQIAKEIHASESTVCRFLRGESVPEFQTMLRLMEWIMKGGAE